MMLQEIFSERSKEEIIIGAPSSLPLKYNIKLLEKLFNSSLRLSNPNHELA